MHYPFPVPRRRPFLQQPASSDKQAARWRVPFQKLFGLFLLLVAAALLPLALTATAYSYRILTGRIMPGITVGGFEIGDLSQDEAARRIDTVLNSEARILVANGEQTSAATLLELGLWVDPERTAASAFELGRGSTALSELVLLFRQGEWSIQPVIVFDPALGRAGLERLSGRMGTPAQNAALRYKDGQWTAVPGVNGSQLDIDQTLSKIAADPLSVLQNRTAPVVIQAVAPAVADLTPQLDHLKTLLDQPLKFSVYDPITDETIEHTVPSDTFAAWVSVSVVDGSTQLTIDQQQAESYLQAWAASLGSERQLHEERLPLNLADYWQSGQPVERTIRYLPTSYIVQPGDSLSGISGKVGMPYWMIQEANPAINPNALLPGQALTIPSRSDLLPLPVVPGKRIVISISQQRLWTYENGEQRSEHRISTGIDRSPTIPGVYQIQTHEQMAYASVWDLYMPHFMGIYQGWPGFMNGLHGLPTLSNGQRLWEGNLGRPVSYGCIILGLQEAEEIFHWAEEGVVVEIRS